MFKSEKFKLRYALATELSQCTRHYSDDARRKGPVVAGHQDLLSGPNCCDNLFSSSTASVSSFSFCFLWDGITTKKNPHVLRRKTLSSCRKMCENLFMWNSMVTHITFFRYLPTLNAIISLFIFFTYQVFFLQKLHYTQRVATKNVFYFVLSKISV